ncbi:glycosyltransferase [Arhodomonas sp. SL1]|uniref:glycosyltransferase n=1 Tax=Arhodomonas sp. SL1 TaxID=3425691 RepID=UPI003F8839C2
MRGPLDLDVTATWQSYARYHEELRRHVDEEKAHIRDAGADLVLADVPYVPIAAAGELGVPAVALCSVNWADVLEHYLPVGDARIDGLVDEIRACYRQAECFIAPTPSMPMPGLENLERVGPIARLSTARPGALRQHLPKAEGKSIVLATMGGITGGTRAARFPRIDGVRWIVPDEVVPPQRPDVTPVGNLQMPFLDVLAGSDVVVTKPGYGTFVEAACHGVPVVYVERDDWPESAALEAWLAGHGVALPVNRVTYEHSNFAETINTALTAPRRKNVVPTGIYTAVKQLTNRLQRSG